jgi:RNA polymerase sigma-70 factor, ECF subfamily
MDPDALRSMVASAATGDEVAFARIVAAHHDDMARVAFVVCGDVELAQDAVQAAWPKVWAKLGSVRDPARLRPWLVSVAANEAKQLARGRNRRRVREITVDVDGGQTAPAMGSQPDPADRAGELDLARALATLDDADRTLVALRYAAGLTSDEIGRAIGMTGGGVRARLARLLDRLRKELLDDEPA